MGIATIRRKIWSGCVTGGCQEPMSKPDIVLTVRTDVTPEQGRNVRARVWRFVLYCHAKKGKAGAPHAGNGEKGFEDDLPANRILPR
jgi:hypothetical protein